jgi:hypothetical protein
MIETRLLNTSKVRNKIRPNKFGVAVAVTIDIDPPGAGSDPDIASPIAAGGFRDGGPNTPAG